MDHKDIIGMSFRFIYADESCLIEILSTDSFRWSRTAGKNTGQSDSEQYVFSSLADDMFMLTWIEADGPGLSNVLELTDNTLIADANIGRDVFTNSGKLAVTQ